MQIDNPLLFHIRTYEVRNIALIFFGEGNAMSDIVDVVNIVEFPEVMYETDSIYVVYKYSPLINPPIQSVE